MNRGLNKEEIEFLYNAVLSLKSFEECEAFFEDLCTIPELKAMGQRCAVAKMLSDGCAYREIVEKTGASTATISRVNRSLMYGASGYALVFGKTEE